MRNPFTFEAESFDLRTHGEREWEAPSEGGSAVTLTCRPPVVLSGFGSEGYALRFAHHTQLLALPLPAPVLVVRGHTDNQGSAVDNRGLSLSRAFEVVQWLTLRNGSQPIAGDLIVQGFGSASPVASNANEAGRSRNRRVEILWCEAPPPPPIVAGVVTVRPGKRTA
jgi:hypothetical protein